MNIFRVWKSFNFKAIILLAFVSVYLVLKWLPNGQIVAGGDIGIPVYNSQKALNEQSFSWWDTHATGVSNAATYTALPFYIMLSFLEKIGFTPAVNQKAVFFIILFSSSLSIYFLALQFSLGRWSAFLAGLFYIFNLTALSVWQRGVHNAMLMMLLAPLSLLILVKGLSSQRYTSIIWISIVSFLLSYVFGALGYVFSLWLLWILYAVIVLSDRWKDKSVRKFILTYYFLLVISWIGTNFWWIFHLLLSGNYVLGQFTATELKTMSSDVLMGLRPYHQPQFILRGLSAFYHYAVKDWGDSYLNPAIILLSWIPTVVVFSTTTVKSNYKLTHWKFLMILTILILAFSKGVNLPLGFLNKFLYDFFPFLAPLRNPYEKVGILLAIPFSLLFALGTSQIYSILKLKRLNLMKLSLIIVVFGSLTVLVWPLWLGKLFVSEGRKYIVSIPPYYKQANNWLQEKIAVDDTRILHLPLSWGESVDYNWGYTGIEPSQYFFNGSSIGYQIGISSVDTRIRDLIISIHNQDTINVQKAFAPLNIGWVVVHNETVWKPRILESPDRINKWLATKPSFLEHAADFGFLSVWRVKDEYRLGHFFSSDKLINLINPKAQASLNVRDIIQKPNDSFLSEMQESHRGLLNKYLSENIIFPKESIIYSSFAPADAILSLKDLGKTGFLPDSPFYPFVILKENIFSFLSQDDPVVACFVLSGKRLKEAALLSGQGEFTAASQGLINYTKQLNRCSDINKDTVIGYINSRDFKQLTLGQLIRQKAVLDNEFKTGNVVKESETAKVKLREYLAYLGLLPRYDSSQLDTNKQRIVFEYYIFEEGHYNIRFNSPDEDLIKNPPKIIQIDEKLVNLTPVQINTTTILYPKYKLNKGFHEIQLENQLNNNLLDSQIQSKKANPDSGFTVEIDPVTKKPVFLGKSISGLIGQAFDLPDIKVGQNYKVNFDVLSNNGAAPFITITHDSDPFDASGNQISAVRGQVSLENNSPDGWENITLNYSPVLNSTSAKLSLILTPPVDAKIKNISFEKVFNHNLLLEEADRLQPQKIFQPNITWRKVNPVLYEVTLDNQESPYITIFSETFHPLWKVIDTKGQEIDLPHFSINGFANAWLVENLLPQKIYVKFILQDTRNKGILISIISLLSVIVVVIVLNRRRKPNA